MEAEEIKSEERRRRPRRGPGHGEVAGLEENDKCSESSVTGLPGAASRQSRRTRPLSLAVQPLNYHRLDPDSVASTAVTDESSGVSVRTSAKHPNMTSQESIGSCSLDVDRSASDRSGWKNRKKRPRSTSFVHVKTMWHTDVFALMVTDRSDKFFSIVH